MVRAMLALVVVGLMMTGSVLAGAPAGEPPVIPVGLDAYRMWDRWPYQRIGVRAYMRSTYDRRGGNEGADASHFLYQEADDFNVTLDVEGPGVLYFARYNHWHGSPWHYEVDGRDHKVQESSSADPTKPVPNSVFMPQELFPSPLTWTWSITKGADLMWVPIPFEKSFRMAYSRTRYGTGYYIYHQYVPDANLSQPVKSWDARTAPDTQVLDLLGRAGTDIAPQGIASANGEVRIGQERTVTLWQLDRGPAMIRAFKLTVPRERAVAFGRTRLRVTWDDRPQPSIDAPVCLFFGSGTLHNRTNAEYLVKALPMNIRFDADHVSMACYFPMPFFKSARVELTDLDAVRGVSVTFEARYVSYRDPPNHVGYFHAAYRDHPEPKPGRDLVLLDTRGVENATDWSGSFVGTSWIFSHRGVLSTLEGDPRFFFDDSQSPQCYGTGTEEWGGGGDYWGGQNMTLPLAGHPVGVAKPQQAKNDEELIQSAYRFLLADLMPFGRNAVIRLEHGGENQSREHYETVTYWYGLPGASLVRTDDVDIGDAQSERAHGYLSPDASEPVTIVSRYEWGIDTIKPRPAANPTTRPAPEQPLPEEVYPAHEETGRWTKGTSEFTVALRPDNLGVLLRRTLDYAYPNQRAEVYVAAVVEGGLSSWEPAGVWYLAGSNTCVYSNPPGELGGTLHVVQTSNRRFRDDEFLIARRLCAGRSAIRVRLVFTPVRRPLFPGQPLPELAWSELRYAVYCYVMPG